jgi:hypothetical protein
MELDCPHLSLARYWTEEDDDRRIALVDSLDALRLCDEGGFEAVSSSDARWSFERESRRLRREIQDFAVRVGLASPFSSSCDHDDLAELVRQAIRRGELVGLRKNPALFVRANQPTIEQRRLVAEIGAKTRGRLRQGGRQYKLVAGDDLNGTSDRDSYDVVARDEARRVLDQLAKEPGIAADLATLLGKARDKLTPDWRPPLAPDGLILLRRNAAMRIASSDTGPALTPSQIKKLATKDWIEIEVFEEDDTPYAGSYRLERPDGTSTKGNFDAKGFFGDYDIETGDCKLFLEERIAARAAAAQVPAAATPETPTTPTTSDEQAAADAQGLAGNEIVAPAADAAPETKPVLLRLHIDPAEAAKMKESFRLFSTDGSYEKSEATDRVPGNDYLDLLYEQVPTNLIYSLEVTGPGITPYFLFQEVPFSQLNGFH